MLRKIATVVATATLLAVPTVKAEAHDHLKFAHGLRACPFEDGGSKFRCVWDARHRGDGEGRSLLIRGGGVDVGFRIITHRRAHRLVNRWERFH